MVMITCPQCGQTAPDETRFCERCGQGLSAPSPTATASALLPLKPGATLKGGFEIVELLSQTSLENCYRASRVENGAKVSYQLRERRSAHAEEDAGSAQAGAPGESAAAANGAPASTATAADEEDHAGPRAKTDELKPMEVEAGTQGAGDPVPQDAEAAPMLLTEAVASEADAGPGATELARGEDLGDVFGRVLALSLT